MKKISEITTIEYKYDSEEERVEHIKEMENNGWICEITLDRVMGNNYWYAKFKINR